MSFLDSVINLYTDLNASITSKGWSTRPIPLQTGVYQGDPLSVNTVMATLSDSLKADQHLGYTFSGSSCSCNILQYADDTCLVADGPSSCQFLLWHVERWLVWSGMKVKTPKCFCLAIKASSGKACDPSLSISGQSIPFIGSNIITFLGGPISVPVRKQDHQMKLEERVVQLLEKVDGTGVSRKQKLLQEFALVLLGILG